MRCPCGVNMVTFTTSPEGRGPYHYYGCRNRREFRGMGPCRQRYIQAHAVEPVIWGFVSSLLKDPERIRVGMDALIDREWAAGTQNANEQSAAWAKKLEECDRLRGAYQDQQAAGLMTLEELASKIKGLEETRKVARAELASLDAREVVAGQLERDRDALLGEWSEMVPEGLDGLTGQERNKVYRMLRLEVTPTKDGFEVTGALCGRLHNETSSPEAETVIGNLPRKASAGKERGYCRHGRRRSAETRLLLQLHGTSIK